MRERAPQANKWSQAHLKIFDDLTPALFSKEVQIRFEQIVQIGINCIVSSDS